MGDPGQEQASKRRKKHLNGGFLHPQMLQFAPHITETGIEDFLSFYRLL
jgi:hypothetical protein